jgi:muconolactone delta-isomerase
LLFHVQIVVQISHDVDSEKIKALGAAEVERAKTLQREGQVAPYMAHCGQMGEHQRFQCEGWRGAARDSNLVTALSLYEDQSDCTLYPSGIHRNGRIHAELRAAA